MTALRAVDLHVGYRNHPDVLAGINLEVEPGQAVAVLGQSGGGKSTLLKAAAGLVPPRKGSLEILGARYPERPERGTVGYVPQRLGLVRHTSILDNLVHGGLHETTLVDSLLHRAPAKIVARSWAAMEEVGLVDKAHEPIHRLSGGQQRRVAVARALVQRPRLLLADEFLGELDPETAELVVAAVQRLQADGTAILMVEHQKELAHRVADKVYRLRGGKLEDA